MEVNSQLSIVMPTYNRAAFLDYSLEIHIPLMKQHNIQICIFDNTSTDNTEQIVLKWMSQYPFLSYHKHETNIGAEANFEKALKYPQTAYVWLLGDTYHLANESINYLLVLIENKKYDAIIFNLASKINIPTKDYDDSNLLLNDLGALMTCLSCLIYSKELINRANFSRYYNSYFMQTGVIFEDICTRTFSIHWVQSISVLGLKHPILQKTNWSHTYKAFEIGCKDWTNFVMSLPPSYTLENKMKCIMDFGKVSRIFIIENLFLLRSLNILNYQVYKKYSPLFPLTIKYSKPIIFLVSIFPRIAYKPLRFLWRFIKRSN